MSDTPTKTEPLIPVERWDAWDRLKGRHDYNALMGKTCFGSVWRGALVNAFALVFPCGTDRNGNLAYRLVTSIWNTKDDTEANHSEFVRRVAVAGLAYDLRAVCYDPWDMDRFAQEVEDRGVKVLKFNGVASKLDALCRVFRDYVASRSMSHEGDPVLTDMVRRCRLRVGASGRLIPSDESSGGDITGVRAVLAALAAPDAYLADRAAHREKERDLLRAINLVNSRLGSSALIV